MPNVVVTPDAFNPHFGALNSPSRSLSHRLPPETRLAWLEYLANVYVQCDDFPHAREIIDEMYFWLVERPRLRKSISVAVQILQRRIDERHDCLFRSYGPDACRADPYHPQPQSSPLPSLRLRDVTATAAANLSKVMNRVQYTSVMILTVNERRRLRAIYKLLKNGYVTTSIREFQRFLADYPNSTEKEAVRKFEFVLKLVKFDLENPDNCVPLWRTTCCMDYKIKRRILDTYELLKAPSASRSRAVPNVFRRIEDIPMYHEVRARLLVATGRTEAWSALRSLHLQDRYVAEACLALKGIKQPVISSYPEIFGDSHPPVSSTRVVDTLDARAQAKDIYQRCIYDHRLGMRITKRCQEGLSEIQGLEKSCPYGGFVRIGLFSQIFGDYLFIKCLSPPATLPVSYVGTPIPLTFPTPKPTPLPSSPVPPLTPRHYRLLERISRVMEDFRDTLHDLEPVHKATLEKIRRINPLQTRPTERVMNMNRNIDEQMDQYLCRMKRYLRHLRQMGRPARWNQMQSRRARPSSRQAMEQISNALADLASDLQKQRDSSNSY